jgi:hypothetical protein
MDLLLKQTLQQQLQHLQEMQGTQHGTQSLSPSPIQEAMHKGISEHLAFTTSGGHATSNLSQHIASNVQ